MWQCRACEPKEPRSTPDPDRITPSISWRSAISLIRACGAISSAPGAGFGRRLIGTHLNLRRESEQAVRLTRWRSPRAELSAMTEAPVEGKLEAMQPLSIISAQTIANTIAPTADYATIANIAPSVVNIETEGPGLSESKLLSMRGFADGQYNVTYDGIPFGDANGETHHTTSYFPAKVLGGEVIDRGPGTAADIGENTFGGTIGLLSKDPRADQAAVLTFSDGSWDTFLGNVEVNTGVMPKLNGASVVTTYQYMSSDGYRTFSYLQRNTYYLKYVQPIGKNTTLTIVGNFNNIKFNNPGSVTQAQINAYGRNFGLDANPFDPNNNYYPYNYQQKQADFEYIGLKSTFGRFFGSSTRRTPTPTTTTATSLHRSAVGGSRASFRDRLRRPGLCQRFVPIRFPTRVKDSPRRAESSMTTTRAAASRLTRTGRLATTWPCHMERTLSLRRRLGSGRSTTVATATPTSWITAPPTQPRIPRTAYFFGYIDTANSKGSPFQPGYQWYMHVYNKTFQPYADVIWKPIKNLTIEAGVKDSNFTIDLEAPVNQGTEKPDYSNNTYTNLEPHIAANYQFTPNWSAYVQLAKGIAYPIVTDEENVPNDPLDVAKTGSSYNPANLKEETTINYQIGTVYKTNRFNGDVDAYLINIDNLVSSVVDPMTRQTHFSSSRRVRG